MDIIQLLYSVIFSVLYALSSFDEEKVKTQGHQMH